MKCINLGSEMVSYQHIWWYIAWNPRVWEVEAGGAGLKVILGSTASLRTIPAMLEPVLNNKIKSYGNSQRCKNVLPICILFSIIKLC